MLPLKESLNFMLSSICRETIVGATGEKHKSSERSSAETVPLKVIKHNSSNNISS